MASKTIDELKSLVDGGTKIDIRDNTNMLFAAQYNGAVYKVSGAEFFEEIAKGMDGHGGILSFEKTGSEGLIDTYTITYADGDVSTFKVSNGKGVSSITTSFAVSTSRTTAPSDWAENVPSTWSPSIPYLWAKQTYLYNDDETDELTYVCAKYGPGISSLTETAREDKKYTDYTFTMTEGDPKTFRVYDGVGIEDITKTGASGLVDTYTIKYVNGDTQAFEVTNGSSIESITKREKTEQEKAERPLDDFYKVTLTNGTSDNEFAVTNGRAIKEIKRTSGTGGAGELDTYTITYNDGSTSTFTVQNGQNGSGSAKSVSGIQADSDGDIPVILQGESSPTTSSEGKKNQLYFDTTNSLLYVCKGSDGTGYLWAAASVTVDSALSESSTNPVQNKVINSELEKKQLLTESLTAESAIVDDDCFPYYDASAKANRKTLWSSVIAKIRTALFATSKGVLRADGSGNVSATTIGTDDITDKAVTNAKIADSAVKTDNIADDAVTNAKIAAEVKESTPILSNATNITTLAAFRGGTVMLVAGTSSDVVITVDGDNALYDKGFEVAIMNMETQSTTIKFTTGNVVAYGLDSWLAASSSVPVLITIEKYSMIALKKIMSTSCWLVTGPSEISGGKEWNPYSSTSST